MRRILTFASLLLFIGSLSTSCATMFGDNNRAVRVKTNVEGATVKLNGNPHGNAPTEVYVNGMGTLSDQVVTVEKEGYTANSQQIRKSFQPTFILNIFNGFIGILVDVLTGNINKVETKEVNIHLEKKES